VSGSKIQVAGLGTVPSAAHATTAEYATSAGRAATADRATSAEHAAAADAATNADHAAAADSAANAANSAALGGVPAARYLTNASVLGSGETEVGGWGASAPNGQIGTAVIDFKPKLGREIPAGNLSFLPFESTSANCPGPRQAAPGYLCVYTSFSNGMSFEGFRSAFSGSTTPAGPETVLVLFDGGASLNSIRGSWAYQEP